MPYSLTEHAIILLQRPGRMICLMLPNSLTESPRRMDLLYIYELTFIQTLGIKTQGLLHAHIYTRLWDAALIFNNRCQLLQCICISIHMFV